MVRRHTVLGFVLIIAAVVAVAPDARANTILNAGFETGSFSGWETQPQPREPMFFVGGNAYEGDNAAWFGSIWHFDESIWQTFATTAGDQYEVTFWLAHGRSWANDFNVWWNNAPLLSLVNASRFGYQEYSYTVTATGPSTTLKFSGRDLTNYYYLDDVSVTEVPDVASNDVIATPEPASLLLVTTGIAALVRRKRARARDRGRHRVRAEPPLERGDAVRAAAGPSGPWRHLDVRHRRVRDGAGHGGHRPVRAQHDGETTRGGLNSEPRSAALRSSP